MVTLSCLKCRRLFSGKKKKKKLKGGLREKKKNSHLHISCPFVLFFKEWRQSRCFFSSFVMVETGLLSVSVAGDLG